MVKDKQNEQIQSNMAEPKKQRRPSPQALQKGIAVGVMAVLVSITVFLMRGQIQAALAGRTLVTQPNAPLMQQDVGTPAAAKDTGAPAAQKNSTQQSSTGKGNADTAGQWNLILVNREHLLPHSFTVELEKTGDVWVDNRIMEPLQQMLQAAKSSHVDLIVASAYRSVSRQAVLYQQEIASNQAQGYDKKTSTVLADQYMEAPGASEHHTGLALDIVTPTYQSLDSGFANTVAFQWLRDNAPKYGFVIRYPENKQKITGILFEPWHFRYVGKDAAQAMTGKSLCLEEYVQTLGQNMGK